MRFLMPLVFCAIAFFAPYAVGSEGLIEDEYFKAAEASGSVRALENFLARFPDSRYVGAAERMISEVHFRQTAAPLFGNPYAR